MSWRYRDYEFTEESGRRWIEAWLSQVAVGPADDESPNAVLRPADDLLFGAQAIAEWMGATERQVYYWRKTKRFGFFGIGDKIVGRKSRIAEELEKLERGDEQ